MGQKNTIKDRIRRIQAYMDINADGIMGPATLTALENRIFNRNNDKSVSGSKTKSVDKKTMKAETTPDNQENIVKDRQKTYALKVSKQGLELIVKYEISSKNYYKNFLSHPVWPGGQSGITIGIGYDLGYNTSYRIKKDWGKKLDNDGLQRLMEASGKKGITAERILYRVEDIPISLESAKQVFYQSSLPRYAAKTKNAYPDIENLFPDAQAGLLSLVYNRGAAMGGAKRKEMAAIKSLVTDKDYAGISDQIIAMKRLWENKGLNGLLERRDSEAKLILLADRTYEESEIVRI